MTIRPPTFVIYGGCTAERAINIIWDRRLRNCELLSRPICGIWFGQDKDLIAFKLAFGEDIAFHDHLAIVFSEQQKAVGAFISDHEMENRVTRADLLGIQFWDREDQWVFEKALDVAPSN
ncbi:hypothetical protein [Microvirga sp. VF16]|uniref:hypothetical protein n=1 Tax=Microvirga sp. VF16 TaxID=2807101 RepID=UPI00193D7C60|nr:hypothetical protein [Microvirga sp. VF16]QRM31090.1 hypothetical protein JO965_08900 [Microvirga sp. VF16]